MSLINEALKKAQRQRSGDQPFESGQGAASTGRVARREKPMGFNFLVIRFVVGCVLTVALLLGGYYLYLRASAASDTPAQSPAATKPLPANASVPASASTSVPPSPPTHQTPAVTASALTSTPASALPPPANPAPLTVTAPPPPAATTVSPPPPALTLTTAESATTGPAPAPAAPAVTKPAAPTKMDPRAIAFIEGLRVSGIRASSTDSKVLMNDRVYRAGDTVEHELGLKLVVIRSNSLTFENEAGLRYTRNF